MKKDNKYEVEKLVKAEKPSKGLQVFIAVIIIIIFASVMLIYVDKKINLKEVFSTNIVNKSEKEVTVTDKGIADAVDKLLPATVIVEVGQSKDSLQGWGSGFVYKKDNKYGYVLTNAHVVENAKYVVIVNSKEEETEGEIVGFDIYTDVAVVKIPVDKVLGVAEIGKSEDVRLGDTVFAIGTPISLKYSFTVTRGILSGKNRMVSATDSNAYGQISDEWYMSLLQIDASINSGNSGGPLANSNGEVIGITNSKLSSSAYMNTASIENLGFAIPIEDAMSVAKKLEKDGKVSRPRIGVTMSSIEMAKRNGIDVDSSIKSGVVVYDVSADSSADKAGMKKGDVITKIGDYEVDDYLQLKYYLYRYSSGDKVKFTIIRNKKEKTIEIKLKD